MQRHALACLLHRRASWHFCGIRNEALAGRQRLPPASQWPVYRRQEPLSARTALCLWSGLGVYCLHLCSPPVGIRRSTAVNESPEDKARKWGVAGGLLRAATTRSAATTTTCQKIGGCLFFSFSGLPIISAIFIWKEYSPPDV